MATTKGRIDTKHTVDENTDIQAALILIEKGFYLTNNNTSLEHIHGGFVKISKRVTNHFNKTS